MSAALHRKWLVIGWMSLLLGAPALAWATASPASSVNRSPALQPAVTQSVAAMVHDREYGLLALTALSATHAKSERLAAVGALTRLADQGNAFAEYVLGSQYMWGPRRPHALLPYDAKLANEYLANAAIRGNLQAMLALAQFELSTHHPMHAMIWAQTLAYYLHQLDPSQKHMHGYLPELIARAQRSLSSAQKAKVVGDVNGVLVRYGKRIEAGMHEPSIAFRPDPLCTTRRIEPPAHMPAFPTPNWSGRYPHAVSLTMLYAVNPAGRIVDHAYINVLPDWHVHSQLDYPLGQMRFNRAPQCRRLRAVIQVVQYDDRRYALDWH